MTSFANATRPRSAQAEMRASASAHPSCESTPLLILLGLALALAQTWPQLVAVWQSGTFIDTDDAMHIVELRDWLAGQAWFDQTAYRLDPPHGLLMHWTHVLDVPMALILRGLELFMTVENAERGMRIVYPILLQVGFFAGVISLARRLLGGSASLVAVILTALSLSLTAEFPPGRINHHNAQIVLLLFMLDALISSFERTTAHRGALAGALAALSLAISIENLPFIMVMVAILGGVWIIRGAEAARAIGSFGASLAVGALLAFVATVPPARYASHVCDAFAAPHLIAAVLGGASFVMLAVMTPRLAAWPQRLGAALAAGGAVAGTLTITFPDCFADPHSIVDPLVRSVWLANVKQARPLGVILTVRPLVALPILMPLALGLGWAGLAAVAEEGEGRLRWFTIAAFAAVGIVGTFWQVRVAGSTAAIAAFGGVWFFVRARQWVAARAKPLLIAPILLTTAFVPIAWAIVLPDGKQAEGEAHGDPEACYASRAFAPLNALPPSRFFAPIDAGSFILAFTHHSVFAAPYHRNNHGNRLALDVLLGDAKGAYALLQAAGAEYLAICPAAADLDIYTARAPHGFAADLRNGVVPDWLERVPIEGTPYRVYKIR